MADTNGFVEGIRILLKENGVAVIEVPYLKDLIDHCEFDTIYHQHLCYFSLSALNRLFRNHSLYINQIRRLPVHGGSLRIYIEHHQNIDEEVWSMLEEEQDWGIYIVDRYLDTDDKRLYRAGFACRIRNVKERQILTLKSLVPAEGQIHRRQEIELEVDLAKTSN